MFLLLERKSPSDLFDFLCFPYPHCPISWLSAAKGFGESCRTLFPPTALSCAHWSVPGSQGH